jgi:hypothetical protein
LFVLIFFIRIIFKVKKIIKKKFEKLEHMEYICNEIVPITQHEKLDVYFLKTKIVDGIFDEFFW